MPSRKVNPIEELVRMIRSLGPQTRDAVTQTVIECNRFLLRYKVRYQDLKEVRAETL